MSEQINTRNLIVDILLAVTRDGEFSHIAIRNVLDKYRYLPRQDRAFITRVSEGTLERMIEIDYIINQFSKTKINKMKPVIRAILRSGVYQLCYMDSVPDSAACNEAVKLAVKRGFSGLKGFVNGVMRSVSRNREQIRWPDPKKEPVLALSVSYSMPEWLVKRLMEQFGEEQCVHILKAFLSEHATCIRVNESRISPPELKRALETQGITVRESDALRYAFFISGYDTLDDIPEFEDGLFYVQNISSMMVVELADPKPGDFVLDVCAAPGGKSVHAAQRMAGTGMVEARDLTDYKTDLIEDNIERFQLKNMRAVCQDARLFDPKMEQAADIVIADLPCSGLGVIAEKTDIKYNASEERILSLAQLQREILSVVHRYVKPGGTLMYSTCTISREENQDNLNWFLREHPKFVLERELLFLPDAECDGFYIAKMKCLPQ